MVLKFGKTVSPENQGEEKGRNASGKKKEGDDRDPDSVQTTARCRLNLKRINAKIIAGGRI
ncbi:hypothetical protein LINGRAHAP2_LOCUS3789 [Linum grandiflorum]